MVRFSKIDGWDDGFSKAQIHTLGRLPQAYVRRTAKCSNSDQFHDQENAEFIYKHLFREQGHQNGCRSGDKTINVAGENQARRQFTACTHSNSRWTLINLPIGYQDIMSLSAGHIFVIVGGTNMAENEN